MTLDRRLIDRMAADVGPEAFPRLARLFRDEAGQKVRDIAALAATAGDTDWRELGRHAHSLKHAAGSFGLIELAAIAFQIEQAADVADLSRVARGVSALDRVADTGLAELSDLLDGCRKAAGTP